MLYLCPFGNTYVINWFIILLLNIIHHVSSTKYYRLNFSRVYKWTAFWFSSRSSSRVSQSATASASSLRVVGKSAVTCCYPQQCNATRPRALSREPTFRYSWFSLPFAILLQISPAFSRQKAVLSWGSLTHHPKTKGATLGPDWGTFDSKSWLATFCVDLTETCTRLDWNL